MNYFQVDSTKMDDSENVSSYDDQNNNFAPAYLTRDQEHVIMISALRQVMISNFGDGIDTSSSSSSNWNACEASLPPLSAGPCPICSITGCYGCAFPRHENKIKKEKKHKGVRKKPSGKWSAEIWDPSLKIRRWLGTFPTAEMAAQTYNNAAAELDRKRPSRRGKNNREGNIHQEDDDSVEND